MITSTISIAFFVAMFFFGAVSHIVGPENVVKNEKELEDETDPDEYEDKSARIKYVDAKHDLKEVTTDEEEFREWDGIEEDWQEFNRKHIHDESKPK